ncbi:hypothetical protein D3C80_1703440 [compost metagenome]
MPPGGAAEEVGHRKVAAVAEGRATVAGGAVAVHQHVEAVHRLHLAGEGQVAFEWADLPVVDHQHLDPRVAV